MLHFLQPVATLFIGLALSVYGLIHSLRHAPQATAFQAAIQAMPDAIAVIVFAFGIAAIVVGIVLLVSGVKGVRRRTHEINNAYGRRRLRNHRPSDEYEDEWEHEMHPAYR